MRRDILPRPRNLHSLFPGTNQLPAVHINLRIYTIFCKTGICVIYSTAFTLIFSTVITVSITREHFLSSSVCTSKLRLLIKLIVSKDCDGPDLVVLVVSPAALLVVAGEKVAVATTMEVGTDVQQPLQNHL
jgi:hypothetical protein